MNQSAKSRFPTLDKATDEISRPEQQLASRGTNQTTTAAKVTIATAPKPVIAPTNKPAPQLGDLNRAELLEALDLANSEGDSQMVATLYAELNRRRK